MAEFNANIVVQPYEITVNVDQPGITVTPNVTDLNIYAVGGTNGVPAGNVGDIQYYAANGFAAIPSNVANYTSGNFNLAVATTKITGGTNGYVLQTDGSGNVSWVAPSGSGNGVVGGSNTQIQFNNNGLFGGNAGFTFDNSTGNVNVPANLIVGGAVLGNVPNANFATYSSNAASANYALEAGLANLANVATIAGTVYTNAQPNITSVGNLTTLTVVGNLYPGSIYTSGVSGNIYGANVITANTIQATAQLNANVANVNTLNITSLANLSSISVNNLTATTANVTTLNANGVVSLGSNSNVRITGGSSGQILSTNGSGNLSWINPAIATNTIVNGTSNVVIPTANSNISMYVANSIRANVTTSGLSVTGTVSATGVVSGNTLSAANGMTVSAGQATFNGDVLAGATVYLNNMVPIGNSSTTSIGTTSQRFHGLWLQGNIEARNPGVANVGSVNATNFGNATGTISATGNITSNSTVTGNIVNFVSQLTSNISPNAAVSTTISHKIPIVLNGVTYYICLTSTP